MKAFRIVKGARWRRLVLNLGLALVVALGVGLGVARLRGGAGPIGNTARTATVSTTDLRRSVTASGQIESQSTVSVDFPAGASESVVKSIDVTVGQQVTAGQVLARVDSTELELEVRSAAAALEAAEETLEEAEEAEEEEDSTTGTALESGAATQSGQGSQVSVAQAEIDVEKAGIVLAEARSDLEAATLVAPIDGTVIAVDGEVGQTASGASSTTASGNAAGQDSAAGGSTSGSTSEGSGSSGGFVEIADLARLQVTTSVSEVDAADVAVGQKAAVVLNTSEDTELAGTVASVDPTPSTSDGVVTYPVVVTLDAPAQGIRLGATAEITIVVEEVTGALVVPVDAVTSRGDADTVAVLDSDGETAIVEVEVGIEGDTGVQVLSGLELGDRVVVSEAATSDSESEFTGPPPGMGFVDGGGPPAGAGPP